MLRHAGKAFQREFRISADGAAGADRQAEEESSPAGGGSQPGVRVGD